MRPPQLRAFKPRFPRLRAFKLRAPRLRIPKLRRRWVLGLLAALAVLAGGGLLLRARLAGRAAADLPPPAPLVALALDAPARLAAGEPLTVTVRASPPISGAQVLLAAQGTSGLLAQSQPLQDGAARFVLPAGWTQAAGAVTLAAIGGGIEARQAITIEPGAAANPLFTLIGPASTPLDGEQSPMLLALPLDVFGNPVAEGAAVTVRTQPPAAGGGKLPPEMIQVLTRDLAAAVRLALHSTAGILRAAASSAGAHSPALAVRITPAKVQDVTVTASPASVPAGGEIGVALETNLLADAYGNVLPDGVAVFFVVDNADGSRRWLPAVTVSGRAAVVLSPPLAETRMSVRALVGEAASAPMTVTFTAPPAIAPFDITVIQEAGGVTLRAGPLLSDLGALAPDGAPVTFTLIDPFGQRSTRVAPAQYGFAEERLYAGSAPPGAWLVTASAGPVAGDAVAGGATNQALHSQAAFQMPGLASETGP